MEEAARDQQALAETADATNMPEGRREVYEESKGPSIDTIFKADDQEMTDSSDSCDSHTTKKLTPCKKAGGSRRNNKLAGKTKKPAGKGKVKSDAVLKKVIRAFRRNLVGAFDYLIPRLDGKVKDKWEQRKFEEAAIKFMVAYCGEELEHDVDVAKVILLVRSVQAARMDKDEEVAPCVATHLVRLRPAFVDCFERGNLGQFKAFLDD